MTKPTCKIKNCFSPPHARGWCHRHYTNWQRYGEPINKGHYWKSDSTPDSQRCSVEACTRKRTARGWCHGHDERWRKHGDPGTSLIAERAPKAPPCKVDTCELPSKGWGLCTLHYRRAKKHGDPLWRAPGEVRNGKRICARCQKDILLQEYGAHNAYCLPCAAEWAREKRELENILILQKTCLTCGQVFTQKYANAVTCSSRCRERRKRLSLSKSAARRRALVMYCEREEFRHEEIFERDSWLCGICAEPVDKALRHPHPASASLDHIIPLSAGGAHVESNVQLAHLRCNLSKGARIT